ncbi:MAG: hypothetical protein IH836_04665 [Proteobacteria bacterium]|nr:hypothetical protein [Pseudomonadota bacterium]MCH9048228.1 hypothetical protein [Pseudomonadota bacterium]
MEPTAEQIQLWYHYEQIAMHFNELIIQYRLQLMGGAGAIGALASYLIGLKDNNDIHRARVRTAVSWILFVLLCAAAVLDLFYYNQLLQGAVDALLAYEESVPGINMSTMIENNVFKRGTWVIYLVYSLILVPLLIFAIWSSFQKGSDNTKWLTSRSIRRR